MRILFDECVPYRLKKDFEAYGHEVKTVQEVGYGNQKINERVIAKAEAGKFAVYVTTESNDKNTFQKDIGNLSQYREQYPLSFMILKVEKGKHPEYENLKPMMPNVQIALENMKNGY
jgi:predicted nuclease of predicted toxin-antitoxin system